MGWLEATALAGWVRDSLLGYPLVIIAHSIGMAIMVGLVFIVNFRLLGLLQQIPYVALNKLLVLAWVGFGINFITGSALFTAYAVTFSANWPYLLKMVMVVVGALTVGYMQSILRRESANWVSGSPLPGMVQALAIGSTVIWSVAIWAGRFTAYLPVHT